MQNNNEQNNSWRTQLAAQLPGVAAAAAVVAALMTLFGGPAYAIMYLASQLNEVMQFVVSHPGWAAISYLGTYFAMVMLPICSLIIKNVEKEHRRDAFALGAMATTLFAVVTMAGIKESTDIGSVANVQRDTTTIKAINPNHFILASIDQEIQRNDWPAVVATIKAVKAPVSDEKMVQLKILATLLSDEAPAKSDLLKWSQSGVVGRETYDRLISALAKDSSQLIVSGDTETARILIAGWGAAQ